MPARFSRMSLAAALLALSPMLALSMTPSPRPLCKPGVTPPSNRFNSTLRLASLRDKMRADLSAHWYLETGLNRLLSSPQPSEKYRAWISGFAGSSGQVLITETEAFLFTDTRYTLQADQELDCHWKFFDTGSVTAWVAAYPANGTAVRLAMDARQIRASDYARLRDANATNVILVPLLDRNLIDELWTNDRPRPVRQELYPLPLIYAGMMWQAKVNETRAAMTRAGVDLLAVTGLDDTAYLLNLRATVLANVPYFPSMVLASASELKVFLDDPDGFLANETLRLHLSLNRNGSCQSGAQMCVTLHPLTGIGSEAAKWWSEGRKVWLDDTVCSFAMLDAFSNFTLLRRTTPVQLAKAVKNPAEQEAFTRCSLMDSAALTAALSQLQKKVANGEAMTELSVSDLVASYRAKVTDFRGLSFETIAASGPNAAVVHYRPSNATNRAVSLSEAFLLDSGGQYLGCTTDVTRTLYFGPGPPTEIRDAYTRVLMGVIDLFNLTWPERWTSRNFDAFARHNLWAVSKDYGHGTGHGIGLFLGVHEGPNGIGRDVGLVEGNFQSIEPGFYQAESAGVLGFGIRLETISGVKKVTPTSIYLRFQPVTWVPFERKLIRVELLSLDQLHWLNWYHAECRARLTQALKDIGEFESAGAWMMAATEQIGGEVKSCTGLRAGGSMAAVALLVAVTWRRLAATL